MTQQIETNTITSPLRSYAEERAEVEKTKAVFGTAQAAFDANPSDTNWNAKEAARKEYEKAFTRHRKAEDDERRRAREAVEKRLAAAEAKSASFFEDVKPEVDELGKLWLRAAELKRSIDDKRSACKRAIREAEVTARELGVSTSALSYVPDRDAIDEVARPFCEAMTLDPELRRACEDISTWLPPGWR